MPRMTDRVYLSDDGRSDYHTCGATPLPAVIDRCFVNHHLHWTAPLIVIVYSTLDRGIQLATEMLPSKGDDGVAHSFNCTLRVCRYASC